MGATCCTDQLLTEQDTAFFKRTDSRTQKAQELIPCSLPDTLGSKRAIKLTCPDSTSRQHPADRSYLGSDPANATPIIKIKLGQTEIGSQNFSLEEYHNHRNNQPLNLPEQFLDRFLGLLKRHTGENILTEDLHSGKSNSVHKLVAEVVKFKFNLTEYPGQTNTAHELSEDDGAVYYGQGIRNPMSGHFVKEGKGYLLSASGSLYAGYFVDSRPEGPGSLLVCNFDIPIQVQLAGMAGDSTNKSASSIAVYTGFWESEGMEGEGILTSASGYLYRGNWHKQFQEGFGTETWPDGSAYRGHFKRGCKHGHGEFIWIDKGRYVGELKEDKIWGFGTFEWSNGNKYQGEWRDNLMHGQGHFSWNDGMEYKGMYLQGKKQGFGILFMEDGFRWEGIWANGKKQGKGQLLGPLGYKVSGTWSNDELVESSAMSFQHGGETIQMQKESQPKFIRECKN